MGILPNSTSETIPTVVVNSPVINPKKTFIFDFNKNEFITDTMGRAVTTNDNETIVRGIVEKIFHDKRYRYLIYDKTYGNEIFDLLAQDEPYDVFETELKRLIREALVFHPYIKDVTNITITREGEIIYTSFVVEAANGIIFPVEREVTSL